MRGKQLLKPCQWASTGNIPAYAGKTTPANAHPGTPAEHPRARGENTGYSTYYNHTGRTSPRTRGKHCRRVVTAVATRNIPAHAGKTAPPAPDVEHSQEYPRVCGENGSTAPWPGSCRGTSPRMRGKPFQVPVVVAHVGNILAYAGKTRWHCACSRSSSEHPRVCGENAARAASVKPLVGTSPRMRGKLPTQIGLKESRGNIPAYAGKTW